MRAATVPLAHSSAPVLHSTLSPMPNRSAMLFSNMFSGVARQALNRSTSAAWSRFLPMKT
eukprot:scaffold26538_cov63-Phaeocystis_antarctica.AAC.1